MAHLKSNNQSSTILDSDCILSIKCDSVNIDPAQVDKDVESILTTKYDVADERSLLERAIKCIDLTTLSGNETQSTIRDLCQKAAKVVPAAVCVYSTHVGEAVEALKEFGINHKVAVASVAGGFPSGQMPLHLKLQEIDYALEQGAKEIDVVINRSFVFSGQWYQLYDEIRQMKQRCGKNCNMKTILATGELKTFENIYMATRAAILAGSDFVKTSTGKEAENATLPIGVVMCRAILDCYSTYGIEVGFKPAGGIKTTQECLNWITLVKTILGEKWFESKRFRIGASSLLGDIEKTLQANKN